MNSSSSRLKRTLPERNRPIRDAMRPPRPSRPQGAARDFVTAAGGAACGLLENGVRTAYAVIDEYMRRGHEAARGFSNDPNRGGYMNCNTGNPGGGYGPGGYGPGGGFGLWSPMASMAEQWIAAMRALNYAWCGYVPGAYQQPGPMPQGGMGQYPSATPRLESFSVRVSAGSPVECTANLPLGCFPQALVCDRLYAEGFDAPPIPPGCIVCDPGTIQVNLKVPDGQKAGRYRGLIRKQADQSAVGSLTVVVDEKPGAEKG